MNERSGDVVRWWGPPCVALGAGLWGLESLFRVKLQETFNADLLVFYEHVLGTLLLLPMLFFARAQVRRLNRRAVGWLLVSGVIGSAFGTVLFTACLKHINISVATLLLNLQPIVAVAVARVALREKLEPGFLKWAALAIAAGAVITYDGAQSLRVGSALGLILVLGTILCWGTATVAGRGMMRETTIFVAAPLRFAIGMAATLGVVAVGGSVAQVPAQIHLVWRGDVLRQYALLLLVAGLTPTFLYFYGLKYTRATAGAFCEMVQAIVAVLVAWLVLGYPLVARQMVAGAVLLFAVAKINLLQARRKASA